MGRRATPQKGKADAKRPLAREAPKDDRAKVRDLEQRLAEAQEQQAATAEILRVISSSPTDVQPVFDTIATSARRLLGGFTALVLRLVGDEVHLAAFTTTSATGEAALKSLFPVSVRSAFPSAQVIRDRTPYVVTDSETDARVDPEIARAQGWRSSLFVPIQRADAAIGVVAVTRPAPGPFTDDEITLLKIFADQAVIAIENLRLFKELESRNRDLTESLSRQTATADILQAINQSPTDTRPVFEAIADSALRLFRAWTATVFRLEGEFLHPLAARGGLVGSGEAVQYRQPQRVTRDFVSGRCIVDRSVVHIADLETDPDAPAWTREIARARGFRAALAVPLLKDSQPIGTIAVSRVEPGRFSDAEIALLKTFADQAVIAIENVRLFTELGERNRALMAAHAQVTEALEQQTATSDILGVISRSPTDVQPVFDTIVDSAARLCDAVYSVLASFDGKLIDVVAAHNWTPAAWDAARRILPALRPGRWRLAGRSSNVPWSTCRTSTSIRSTAI